MSAYELCRKYLDAVNRKDLTAILFLFATNATARAPISGTLHVEEFYARLFLQDKKGIGKIHRIFESPGTTNALVRRFLYTYVLDSGKAITFDRMTVFEMLRRYGARAMRIRERAHKDHPIIIGFTKSKKSPIVPRQSDSVSDASQTTLSDPHCLQVCTAP